MRRILITGGTGFVGSHLIALLRADNTSIISMSSSKRLADIPGAEYLRVDIRNPEEVRVALREASPDEIYHLAAVSAVDASWKNPRHAFDVNVLGSYNIFDAALNLSPAPRVLNVSTSQVYASSDSVLTESSPLHPDNPYAATKAMTELLTVQYGRSRGGGIITVRPFNHTGPGQLPHFVLSSIAKQLAEIRIGIRPAVLALGNINVRRDFTDVRDVVRAYKMIMDKGSPGETYNVCSGTTTGLREIVEMFRKAAGVEVSVESDNEKIRSNDSDIVWGSPSKIRERTGWIPEIPMVKTIQDMLTFWGDELLQPSEKPLNAE